MKTNELYEKKITQEIEELLKSAKGIKLDKVIVNEDNIFPNRYCVFSRFSVLNNDKQWKTIHGEWKHNYDFPKEKPEDVVMKIVTNFINKYFEGGQVDNSLYCFFKEEDRVISNKIRSFGTNKLLEKQFVNNIVNKAMNIQPTTKNFINKMKSCRLNKLLHKDFLILIKNIEKEYNCSAYMNENFIEFKNCMSNEKKGTQTVKGDER